MDTDQQRLIKLHDAFKKRNPDINRQLIQNELTYHSISIEGSILSHQQVQDLIKTSRVDHATELEHNNMAWNHANSLRYVLHLAKTKETITQKEIQTISAHILQGTGKRYEYPDGRLFTSFFGEFRQCAVYVGRTEFLNYKLVPDAVAKLLQEINNNLPKATSFIENSKLAYKAHYKMVNIHPFVDGNGRLSRLMQNYVQAYHNYPITPVLIQDRFRYYDALQRSRNGERYEIFEEFMLGQSSKYFEKQLSE